MSGQSILIETDRQTFRDKVQRMLDDGWTAVPGTVVASIGLGSYHTLERYVIVLERPQ